MSRPTLDAATLAARMNARPLPEDCDGGVWRECNMRTAPFPCDTCGEVITRAALVCGIGGGCMFVCLPCALADCERAEAAFSPDDAMHASEYAMDNLRACDLTARDFLAFVTEHYVGSPRDTVPDVDTLWDRFDDMRREQAAHRAADPHCTCNDCMAHTIATTERTD